MKKHYFLHIKNAKAISALDFGNSKRKKYKKNIEKKIPREQTSGDRKKIQFSSGKESKMYLSVLLSISAYSMRRFRPLGLRDL